jgi:hypothetical protein
MNEDIKAAIARAFGESVEGERTHTSQFGRRYVVQRLFIPCREGELPTAEDVAQAFLFGMPNEEGYHPMIRRSERIVWRRDPEVEWRPAGEFTPAAKSFSGEDEPAVGAGLYGSIRYHTMRLP